MLILNKVGVSMLRRYNENDEENNTFSMWRIKYMKITNTFIPCIYTDINTRKLPFGKQMVKVFHSLTIFVAFSCLQPSATL